MASSPIADEINRPENRPSRPSVLHSGRTSLVGPSDFARPLRLPFLISMLLRQAAPSTTMTTMTRSTPSRFFSLLPLLLLLLLVLASGASVASARSPPSRRVPSALLEGVVSASHASPSAHATLARPPLYDHLHDANPALARAAQSALNCSVCEGLVSMLLPLVNTATTEQALQAVAIVACQALKPLCHSPAACAEVCNGIVTMHTAQIFKILFSTFLTPIGVCAALQECPIPPTPVPSTDIPVRSDLTDLRGEIEWPSWQLKAGTGTFVHLSDVHVDTTYAPGMTADCPLPVCCHATDGPATDPSKSAGFYGDYACDTPPPLAQELLDYLSQLGDRAPDFIIDTGDDPAHDVWKQTRADTLLAIQVWSDMLNKTFGQSIPVFKTLGNHEIAPVNQFAGPVFDSWLYDACVDSWGASLPEDAQRTMRYGGYYQARARPGLRVVSLNSNYFTNDNFYLLANMTDGQNQLNWLNDVLAQASNLGDKVIIICHAPLVNWNDAFADAFLAIATKYRSTIVNAFMGHTHNNQYQALHERREDGSQGEAAWVAWVGGSVVPYTDVNPGFMRYFYDRAAVASRSDYSALVQQAVGHWIDLRQANAANSTRDLWADSVRYNVTADLGVETLDAASLAGLAPLLASNGREYQSYVSAMFKGVTQPGGAPSPQGVSCGVISDTAAQKHACLHEAGHNEKQIQAIEKKERDQC